MKGLNSFPGFSNLRGITYCSDRLAQLLWSAISVGNSMSCSDNWHKYHDWYFEIGIRKGEWNLRQFWNIMSGISAKYHVQIMLLFVYTTTREKFVIFTCRYFKLSWNTTALSQSNCRNFSCTSIENENQHCSINWEKKIKSMLYKLALKGGIRRV